MDGDKPICYIKENIQQFMDPNPEMKWFQFIPDNTVNKVKEHYNAGLVSMKLSIWDVTTNGGIDFRKERAWKKDPNRRAIPVTVRAYVYQCKDLPAADSDGNSDPFCVAWDINDQKPKKTQVIEDNCNPLFYEVLELDYEVRDINDLKTYPPFIIDIFDHDAGNLTNS